MISVFNAACRRPHLPREQHVRDMMKELSIEVKFKTSHPDPDGPATDDESSAESAEEEAVTDDECVEEADLLDTT